jgi:hypothetical protein
MSYIHNSFLPTIGIIRRHNRQATCRTTRRREPEYYLKRAFIYTEIRSVPSYLLAHDINQALTSAATNTQTAALKPKTSLR